MKCIWSYLIVALYLTLTSARIMDFPGNRNGSQDNLISGVENEKIFAPPTTSGLIIDSNGYPGNSNGEKGESRTENLPSSFKNVLRALFNQFNESNYDIIPFSKGDIISMEKSDLCRMMCEFGVEKPPCKCR